jgi:release factor glutamine methyltransferase
MNLTAWLIPVWRMTKSNAGEWLVEAVRRLAGVSENPGVEAQALLAHYLGKPRAWALAHPEAEMDSQTLARLTAALDRLVEGYPLPYLTGFQEFYGLPFRVTSDVLIPRPETELLVEQALVWLRENPGRRQAVDIGTGSGCIAVSLAKHIPDVQVTAVDISAAALEVARGNAVRNGVSERICFIQSDLLAGVTGRFDLLCANLPYIPTSKLPGLAVARHEPMVALDGGTDGLEFIRRLLAQSVARLAEGGLVLLETEAGGGEAVQALAREYLPAAETNLLKDAAGHPRIVKIQDCRKSNNG